MKDRIIAWMACCFLCIYAIFAYIVSTPFYTCYELRSLTKNFNMAIFERCVDLPSVVNNSYDVVMNSFLDTSIPASGADTYLHFTNLLCGPLNAQFLKLIDSYLNTGKWPEMRDITMDNNRTMDIDYDVILRRSLLEETQIDELAANWHEADGGKVISMTVQNKDMQVPFTLSLLLKKSAGGYWRVVKILNYAQYVHLIEAKRTRDIDAYQKLVGDRREKFTQQVLCGRKHFNKLLIDFDENKCAINRRDLINCIDNEVLPVLLAEQQYMNACQNIPLGAQRLHAYNLDYLRLRIAMWQKYKESVATNNSASLVEAISLQQKSQQVENQINSFLYAMPIFFHDKKR